MAFSRLTSKVYLAALAVLATVLPAGLLQAQQSTSSASAPVLAIFDGTPILEDQLPPDLLSQLRRMEQQIYVVRLRGLHEVIDKRLIDAEAQKQKVTSEQLIRSQIANVPAPTDEQMKTYFEDHKAAINQPFEEAREGIRTTLKNTAIQNAGRSYTQTLLQDSVNNGQLTLLLRRPQVDVNPDPKRLRGDASAPVTIVEFADFSCTYCKKTDAALNDLLAQHPGQVRVSYRDFPLTTVHPNAERAAEASQCAADQNHYWPFHDVLFSHIDRQSHDDLVGYARDLKLDVATFTQCIDSGRHREEVERDRELGLRAGVVATPAFFVNGNFLEGAQSVATFETAIRNAASAQAQNRTSQTQATPAKANHP